MSNFQHNASSIVPHFEALQDIRVAADIADGWFENDMNFAQFGFHTITMDEIRGAAIGVPGATHHSYYGVFTDDNGNEYIIVMESKPIYKIIEQSGMLRNVERFDFERHMGPGMGEYNSMMVQGVHTFRGEDRDATSWGGGDNKRFEIGGRSLPDYNTVRGLCGALQALNVQFDKPILIVLSGEPITFQSAWDATYQYIAAAASAGLALIGVPPQLTQAAFSLANSAVNGEKVQVNTLIQVASAIVPVDYRPYMNKAESLITNIQRSDYAAIADTLGIPLDKNIRGVISNLQKGNYADIVLQYANDYVPTISTIQNSIAANAVNKLAANLRTNTIGDSIIDAGTSILNDNLQQIYASCSNGTTLPAVLPGVASVVNAIATGTNDITSPEIRRGFMNMLAGQPTGTEVFDGLLLNSMKQKANELASIGKNFVMPIYVPLEKRFAFGRDIAEDVGVQVIIDSARSVYKYSEYR
ncbi:MAG: hypothetical protein JNL32_00245 [Candidatus Kapabacteria bacterium]|nr:hypothetical protein [Candidatus Kapabacteria bacterium]